MRKWTSLQSKYQAGKSTREKFKRGVEIIYIIDEQVENNCEELVKTTATMLLCFLFENKYINKQLNSLKLIALEILGIDIKLHPAVLPLLSPLGDVGP